MVRRRDVDGLHINRFVTLDLQEAEAVSIHLRKTERLETRGRRGGWWG